MAHCKTLRGKNTRRTPVSDDPSNQKIFHERIKSIKKWYSAWNESQRWTLLEYLLQQQNDTQLSLIHSLLHTVVPPPNHDFTRVLPRHLSMKIFVLLDPQSLCRAAQVSWFWKFLTESNSMWQKKCLKLGWFLPSPPTPYDYTVWKRHYIACVCQLHWNPPQADSHWNPPQADSHNHLLAHAGNTVVDSSDQNHKVEMDNSIYTDEANRENKRQDVYRHPLAGVERKPWRDPDKHPHDTFFKYTNDYFEVLSGPSLGHLGRIHPDVSMNLSASPVRSDKTIDSTTSHSHLPGYTSLGPVRSDKNIDSTTSPSHLPGYTSLQPLDSLMHPVLLEKMRLGSPSSSHIKLSTLNADQSQQDIIETFYNLHKTSPFPKLPPYYVHKPGNPEMNERRQSELGSATSIHTSSRPPSGRMKRNLKVPNGRENSLERSKETELIGIKRTSSPVGKHTGRKEPDEGYSSSLKKAGEAELRKRLKSKPWILPESDDDL